MHLGILLLSNSRTGTLLDYELRLFFFLPSFLGLLAIILCYCMVTASSVLWIALFLRRRALADECLHKWVLADIHFCRPPDRPEQKMCGWRSSSAASVIQTCTKLRMTRACRSFLCSRVNSSCSLLHVAATHRPERFCITWHNSSQGSL